MASWCATNLRDCKAWIDIGLPMTTTSNEAARLYDALLRQYVSWSDCELLGGVDTTIDALKKADPDCVMGRVLTLGLEAMGTGRSTALDEEYASDLARLLEDANKFGNEREKMHVKALNLFTSGEMKQACVEWERILRDAPTDLLALKFAHDAYFYLGDRYAIRDSVARVLPHWNATMPCYSYLYGMYAFGLEECEEYGQAEQEAIKDAWATHARAHCMEMNGRFDEGIAFMESTVQDWSPCFMIACHNYWHTALFYLEKADYETVLTLYDNEIGKRSTSSGAMLDTVDAASLLFRLQMEGVQVEKRRWTALLPIVEAHIDGYGFQMFLQKNFIEYRMQMFSYDRQGDNHRVMRQVGDSVLEAISSYCKGDFKQVIQHLAPTRQKLFELGGSTAQRDVFAQLLIQSCLRSPDINDRKLAR
ncbi:unnamed protein product [Anisakis simplex]|uniref:Tetratricopeptide repeat protein 38 n=1 Tax=Anisakis simplex TaxID=6269 RepID=A0A0M3KA17_ANISI|nr:unnamed protein product [Anisakis simplex]